MRISGAPSASRPFQTAPSGSMPATVCESRETAMSTRVFDPEPALPGTGRTPSGISRTTPSGRVAYPADPGGIPFGSTAGQESRGCGEAAPGTSSGWPPAVMSTACTSGSCFSVHTICCDMA